MNASRRKALRIYEFKGIRRCDRTVCKTGEKKQDITYIDVIWQKNNAWIRDCIHAFITG